MNGIERGKVYLSLVTLYLGLLGVAADKVIPKFQQSTLVSVAYLLSLGLFFLALAMVVAALGIYSYVYPTDLKRVIDNLGDAELSDPEFFDDRMVELAAAFHINQDADGKRATYLWYASWFMLAGMFSQALVLSSLTFLKSAG